MKTILFLDANMSERGVSVSTYDYANYNETILGNKSIIVSLKTADLQSFEKYNKRFPVILLDSLDQCSKIGCDYFYMQKSGHNDGVIHKNAKNLVHVVFPCYDPHGYVYAYISKWLSNHSGNNSPYVPYIVNLPHTKKNLKNYLNINNDDLVIGWFGGVDSFDIELGFTRQVVIDVSKKRKDIKFVFMNQKEFSDEDNIFFIKGTTDLEKKVAFINTCDVMIHARGRGETFGLAIAEFSIKNKPIITFGSSPERNHIEILGDKGIYYYDYNTLYDILMNIQKSDIDGKDWNCYREFTPNNIMTQFNNIFLN